MRVCVFSPWLDALTSGALVRQVRNAAGPGEHEFVLLTNSWADIPSEHEIHATGAAHTASMRALRRALSGGVTAGTLAALLLGRRVGPALVEAVRAADPDLVMCATPAVATQLRTILTRAGAPWPCVSVAADVPRPVSTWRRYDPSVKVSIVLPTYNGTRFLREAIASCLNQSFRNIELVVVDDGSVEPVEAVVRTFADDRLVFVRHERNQGLPESLNTGFRHATGEYCSWTSDDNLYLPDAIEQMVRFIQTYPQVDFVYGESYRIDERGVIDPQDVLRTAPVESLARDNYIGACFLYKRAVYEQIGDFNASAVLAEDYDYWLRVAQRFEMQRIFRRLYCYRYHGGSLTAKFDRTEIARRVQLVQRAHDVEGAVWHR